MPFLSGGVRLIGMFKLPLTRRRSFADLHEDLDPHEDRGRIFEQLIAREFPVEFLLAAELAQLRSFTIPNGSKLLHRTGEFEKHSLKRLDDTRAILVEMGRYGFHSDHARETADHLNALHGFYDIPNDEFLYTLSTFIFDVWLLINRYGWRRLTPNEEKTIYYIYRDMGKLMHIRDIPDSFEAFWGWRQAYEREHQAYAPENHLVAEGLMRGLKEMVPAVFRPTLLPFILSLEDDRFARLLGYRRPNILVRALVRGAMRLRALINRFLTVWDVWSFEDLVLSDFKSYPHGYHIHMLGPDKLLRQLRKKEKRAAAD